MTTEVKDWKGDLIGSAEIRKDEQGVAADIDLRTPEQKARDAEKERKRHFPGGPKPTPKVPELRLRKRRAAKQARKHNR